MSVQKASCIYRGNTFYCDYTMVGVGSAAEVIVRYNGEELKARKGGLSAIDVAETLLSELVVLEAIANKVVHSMNAGEATPIRTDARERRAAA